MNNLGIIASQISGHLWAPSGAYDSIASVTLSAATSTISFTGIPQTYTHLQLRLFGRSSVATTGTDAVYVQANGDSTSGNYKQHYVYAYGASTPSAGTSTSTSAGAPVMFICANNNTASVFGVSILDILDYTNTNKYKTFRNLSGTDSNTTTGGEIWYTDGLWMSSNALTSLTFSVGASNFQTYSSFALYGIR
jgi:hypothetical protein